VEAVESQPALPDLDPEKIACPCHSGRGDRHAANPHTARVEELERANLRRALEATHGGLLENAEPRPLLGMNPSTLRSRMKALGVAPGNDQKIQLPRGNMNVERFSVPLH